MSGRSFQSLPWAGGAPIMPVRSDAGERELARRQVARIAVRLDDRAAARVVIHALGLDLASDADAGSGVAS